MILKELKCPGCGAPIKSKTRDMMMQCSHCGKIHLYTKSEKGLNDVSYQIVGASKEGKDELIYVPFWVVHAEPMVRKEKISGGRIGRFIKDQRQMRGMRDFYVCATSEIPEEFSRIWNMDLTLDQPELFEISDFRGGKRALMTMEKETAGDNAEFLFLRYETEIPGTLQDLDYDFTIKTTRVIYIPAYKSGKKFTKGV